FINAGARNFAPRARSSGAGQIFINVGAWSSAFRANSSDARVIFSVGLKPGSAHPSRDTGRPQSALSPEVNCLLRLSHDCGRPMRVGGPSWLIAGPPTLTAHSN